MYFDKRKKSELKKNALTGLSIEKLTPSTSILSEKKNAIFQNDQTHKNREVERGRSAEL